MPVRPSAKCIALSVVVTILTACDPRGDPQAALDHATRTFHQGDFALAEKEAQKGYQRFHDLGPEWSWKFKLLRADILAWRRRDDQVLELLATEPVPPPSKELILSELRLKGLAYIDLHRFSDAEQALAAAERLCNVSSYGICVNVALALGELEMQRGRFGQAQMPFELALNRARLQSDNYGEADALLSLSWSALQQEHFDQALDWASASQRLSAAIKAASIEQVALGNEGWAYYRLGEPEKAFALFVEATARAHKIGATTDEVRWLTTAGYVYLDAQEYDKAQQSYQHALELARQTNSKEDTIDVLMSLALVSERSGKLDQARDYADQTIALVPKDGNRLDVLYPMLVKAHVAGRLHDVQQAENIYRDIENDEQSHVYLKWQAEHSLAQLYEEQGQPDAAEREYRAALNTFEVARCSLQEGSSLPFRVNATAIYDDYIRFLVQKAKANEALQVAEYHRGRTLAEGLGLLKKCTGFKPDDPNALATARKMGGTILFYWLGEKQSYLWAITPQKITIFSLPPRSQIDPVARRYRKALADQEEFLQRTTDDGVALYRMLVEPASTLLPRDGKVFIIPDGSLNTLNFETLLVPGSSPHYWIEDATIIDASSLRLLAKLHPKQHPADNLLILGNAVAPNSDYPELRKASVEIESIEQHFPSKQENVLTRERATPAAYLSGKPEQYSLIHFVAHGTANRTSPLDSAIVLSRSNAQEDSFKLYARDIIHHPIHAELVTISTCFGAGSRAYSGEGLVGLSWAFLRAGAHNVVGALWEVSDVSTPQLMNEFYGDLQKGETPDTALRNAKLTMLRSHTYAKPFYWAPFQLYTGS